MPGWVLGSIDLHQAEIKVFAALSGEQKLIDAINAGADVHTQTAQLIFKTDQPSKAQRTVGKRVGFGVITGISGAGLYDQMRLAGITEFSKDNCDQIIEEYFRAYPRGRWFIEDSRERANAEGLIRDEIGRVRYLTGIWHHEERLREDAMRQSHSHRIQATAQAHLKMAMAAMWKDIQYSVEWLRPLLQIHDELIFECKQGRERDAEALIVPHMDSGLFRLACGVQRGRGVDDKRCK